MIEQLLRADRLLAVDQVDQAEAVYRSVASLDPRDAIAVVGLARCALARGDDRRAHELAAKALTIDPEDDMARRMEARLAEVLALRGEPVERPHEAATPGPRDMRPVVAGAVVGGVAGGGATVAEGRAAEQAPRPRGLLERLLGR